MTSHRRRQLLGAVAAAGLVLTLAPAAAQAGSAAPAPLHLAAAGTAVPGSYVVVLDSGATSAAVDSVAATAVAAGGSIANTYTATIRGFSATLTPAALAAVRAADGVAYVDQDSVVTLDESEIPGVTGSQQGATWGIDRSDQRNLPLDQTYNWKHTGTGVNAYVIDTGVRFTHNEFEGRAVSGPDFYDDDDDSSDCHGHGTHVAGTIGGKTYGIAKNVGIVGLRVLSCGGSGVASDATAAIDWVVANATTRAVINMSLHYGPVQSMDDAIAAAFKKNVLLAAAAGNFSESACIESPARAPDAITVAASNISDMQTSWSNFGPCVDLYAPGENILSAGLSSDSATATMSGTSMSTPHVAGGIALILEKKPAADGAAVTKLLLKKTSAGKIKNPTQGTPNKLLFTKKF